MNESPDRQVRKFNPGMFQSDQEVIEQFVVRKGELDIVLEVLRGNIDSPSCQHVLVVAPRGRGKTMLLARVAAELRVDDKFSGHLLPVRFMEESHEIFDLADFWLEVLFYLAKESVAHDPEFARELRETRAALTDRWREQALEEHARVAVLDAADRLDKKLVLMVENLQMLCENVHDDFGWKLREVLQSNPQIILLATATSHFEGLDGAEQPFFELFRTIDLKPLDTEACQCLWQTISDHTVSERKIRPLEILTGGSPRLLAIIAEFARHWSLLQLMEELVKLVDDHTEYFRSHLEALAKTERRVYLAVIDLWQPSSTSEIAVRARLDVRTVSTMLGRLINRGAVIMESSNRKRQYYVAERLYSIYYKLRRERDEATVVQGLIHIMAALYSEERQTEMFCRLNRDAAESSAIREGLSRAVAELPQFNNLYSSRFASLGTPASAQLSETNNEWDKQLSLSQDADSSQVPGLLDVWKLHERAVLHEQASDLEAAIETYGQVVERFGDSEDPSLQKRVAAALICKGDAQRKLNQFGSAIETYGQVVERFGSGEDSILQQRVAVALICKGDAQRKLNQFGSAIEAYGQVVERFGDSDEPDMQWWVAFALTGKGDAQRKLNQFELAIETYGQVVERFGDSDEPDLQQRVAVALTGKGDAQGDLNQFGSAIEAYGQVVDRFGDSDEPDLQQHVAVALIGKGDAQGDLNQFGSAIETYGQVVDRFGDSDEPDLQRWVAVAFAKKGKKQTEAGLAKEALHTCEEFERWLGAWTGNRKIEFEWRAMWIRVKALLVEEKRQTAMDAFCSAYAMFVPDNKTMIHGMLQLVIDLTASGVSEHDLIETLSSDRTKADVLKSLIVALCQRAGEKVRAPVEMLEVADDIHKRIEAEVEKGTSVTS